MLVYSELSLVGWGLADVLHLELQQGLVTSILEASDKTLSSVCLGYDPDTLVGLFHFFSRSRASALHSILAAVKYGFLITFIQ